jgi:hypothetical protein
MKQCHSTGATIPGVSKGTGATGHDAGRPCILDPIEPTPQAHRSSYDPFIVLGLGLVTLEFSRLEATVHDLLAMLITPHRLVGQMAVAGEGLSMSIRRSQALVEARLEEGQLRSRMLDWLKASNEACEARNTVIHARWAQAAVTIKVSVKHGQLKHAFTHVTPEQLADLAERMWSLHEEGSRMSFELVQAGLAGITHLGSEGAVQAPPSGEYQLPDVPALGRPDPPPEWRGRDLLGIDPG